MIHFYRESAGVNCKNVTDPDTSEADINKDIDNQQDIALNNVEYLSLKQQSKLNG